MDVYARAGVPYLWLLDPEHRTLETYHCENDRWVRLPTFGGDEPVRAGPFEAVERSMPPWWLPADDQPR
jgi:hypothetical protein